MIMTHNVRIRTYLEHFAFAIPRNVTPQAIKDGDCCDAVGRDVLACEIEAWKTSYVNELVTGCSGQGEAQEARARMSSKVGVDGENEWITHTRKPAGSRDSQIVFSWCRDSGGTSRLENVRGNDVHGPDLADASQVHVVSSTHITASLAEVRSDLMKRYVAFLSVGNG